MLEDIYCVYQAIFYAGAALLSLLLAIYIVSTVQSPCVDYKGRHVLITGGSQGIGFEAAKEYLSRGANVTIVARRPDVALEELKQYCQQATQQVNAVTVDISSGMEQVQTAFEPILKEVGDVHTIINSAGISEAR